jgi:hypothetical protein
MDLILYLFGFSFSFFFLLLSYWKEDRILNIFGSISLMIICLILIGTSVQEINLVPTSSVVTTDPDTNATITNVTYTQQPQNHGMYLESLGFGLMMFVFTAIQYLYFTMSHEVAVRIGR